jgi:hypothetical protein
LFTRLITHGVAVDHNDEQQQRAWRLPVTNLAYSAKTCPAEIETQNIQKQKRLPQEPFLFVG